MSATCRNHPDTTIIVDWVYKIIYHLQKESNCISASSEKTNFITAYPASMIPMQILLHTLRQLRKQVLWPSTVWIYDLPIPGVDTADTQTKLSFLAFHKSCWLWLQHIQTPDDFPQNQTRTWFHYSYNDKGMNLNGWWLKTKTHLLLYIPRFFALKHLHALFSL